MSSKLNHRFYSSVVTLLALIITIGHGQNLQEKNLEAELKELNLQKNETYFVVRFSDGTLGVKPLRTFVAKNDKGTFEMHSISNDTVFLNDIEKIENLKPERHYVGEFYGGGIVFAVYDQGRHGFIASLHELGPEEGVPWSNIQNELVVQSPRRFDDGFDNTFRIVNQPGHTSSAAQLCRDFRGGGFDDWYLPSFTELELLGHSRPIINPILLNDGVPETTDWDMNLFVNRVGMYWSSTQSINPNSAIAYHLYGAYAPFKDEMYQVRAIRKF